MIEVHPAPGNSIIIRFRGKVNDPEFMDLATTISSHKSMDGLLIYFDWLGVTGWSLPAAKVSAMIAWRDASKMIKRASIVHDNCLNRQAAWLAAVLRSEGVAVRSWRPKDTAAAANWLYQSSPRVH